MGYLSDLGVSSFSGLLSGSARQLAVSLIELVPEGHQLGMLLCQLLSTYLHPIHFTGSFVCSSLFTQDLHGQTLPATSAPKADPMHLQCWK